MSLVDRDLAVVWHPATHFSDHDRLPPLPVTSARGAFITLEGGRRILDAISSWWTCLHGHGHPTMVSAITEQVARLDHVMFAGFTHASAVELAEALRAAAPPGYGRVFYADCGSAAVEVALKMSYQSRRQRGETGRTRFAALRNSYHGETLGALAVSGNEAYRELFAPLLPTVTYLPAPDLDRHPTDALGGTVGADTAEADRACAILDAEASELTALVIEPLVQCAGKMAMTGTGYYRRIVEHAQCLGIHVIADEIAVAFGRCGRVFASDWAGVSPDFLCLSKGLSGGVLPLSCVLIRAGFEDDFRGAPQRSFLHSHTFTGNPIACAAGLASLGLLQARMPTLPATVAALQQRVEHVAQHRCVARHRQAGMIAAFDVRPAAGARAPADGRLGLALREAALARGVLLRPLHDTIYWMPPLCIDASELDTLASVTLEVLEAVLA